MDDDRQFSGNLREPGAEGGVENRELVSGDLEWNVSVGGISEKCTKFLCKTRSQLGACRSNSSRR